MKDSILAQKSEVIYLGVTIYSRLNWIPHLHSITQK